MNALSLFAFVAIIVLPMVGLWYATSALGWGLNHYPRSTWLVIVLLVAALLFAALSFHHFFPNCGVGLRGRVVCNSN
ncbi:MAG TPA: hypothetical protein VGG10_12645 [Rhizomicrobium sp.]